MIDEVLTVPSECRSIKEKMEYVFGMTSNPSIKCDKLKILRSDVQSLNQKTMRAVEGGLLSKLTGVKKLSCYAESDCT